MASLRCCKVEEETLEEGLRPEEHSPIRENYRKRQALAIYAAVRLPVGPPQLIPDAPSLDPAVHFQEVHRLLRINKPATINTTWTSQKRRHTTVWNLIRCEADVISGVRRLLEKCNGLCPASVWHEIDALDFTADSDHLKRWLHDLLETEAPDQSVVAFWFGIFDETGPDGRGFARLYLAGSECYDPDDATSAWACSPTYFPRGRYADSRVLRSMSAIFSAADEESSRLGSYVLPLGYASLAVAEACRQLPPDLLLGRRTSRAVAVGFDSGDFITLPVINREI